MIDVPRHKVQKKNEVITQEDLLKNFFIETIFYWNTQCVNHADNNANTTNCIEKPDLSKISSSNLLGSSEVRSSTRNFSTRDGLRAFFDNEILNSYFNPPLLIGAMIYYEKIIMQLFLVNSSQIAGIPFSTSSSSSSRSKSKRSSLSIENLDTLFLICLLLSLKMYEDGLVKSIYFYDVYGERVFGSMKKMNRMEIECLNLLGFKLLIPKEDFEGFIHRSGILKDNIASGIMKSEELRKMKFAVIPTTKQQQVQQFEKQEPLALDCRTKKKSNDSIGGVTDDIDDDQVDTVSGNNTSSAVDSTPTYSCSSDN